MVEEFGLPAEIISNAAVVWGAKVHEQDRQAFLESNQEIADGRTDCHSVEYRAKNRHGSRPDEGSRKRRGDGTI